MYFMFVQLFVLRALGNCIKHDMHDMDVLSWVKAKMLKRTPIQDWCSTHGHSFARLRLKKKTLILNSYSIILFYTLLGKKCNTNLTGH